MAEKYFVYTMAFSAPLHAGSGALSSSLPTLGADVLFSALYIEALKAGCAEELYGAAKEGAFRISDAFPFSGEELFLPKPMIRIDADSREERESSVEKKFYKNLKYVPVNGLEAYLAGQMPLRDQAKELYSFSVRTVAAVRREEGTLPYQVGLCHFRPGAGLYVVLAVERESERRLFERLMAAVAVVGLGGKRANGFGRFSLRPVDVTPGNGAGRILERLSRTGSRSMLLSAALPRDAELEEALEGAVFSLVPRTGFVLSEDFAPEQRKKKPLFVMEAGSCLAHRFQGDIYDVSGGRGSHPVYRYAKPLFLDV